MGGRLGDDIEAALSVDPKISKLPRIRTLGIVFVCRVLLEWNAVSGLLASARVRRADSVPFFLHQGSVRSVKDGTGWYLMVLGQ